MQALDAKKFENLLLRAGRFYQRGIDAALLEDYWEILEGYDFAAVEKAFFSHFSESKFFPTPADIIGNMPTDSSRHPAENEAWGIALLALDDNRSVIYTEQIAVSIAAARHLFNAGDLIAARMAFKDAYRRNVQVAPNPVWLFSQGYDRTERAEVALKAHSMGIIGESLVLELVANYVPKDPRLLALYRLKNSSLLTH